MGGVLEAEAQRDFADRNPAIGRIGKSSMRGLQAELAQRRAHRLALVLKDAVQVAHGYPH